MAAVESIHLQHATHATSPFNRPQTSGGLEGGECRWSTPPRIRLVHAETAYACGPISRTVSISARPSIRKRKAEDEKEKSAKEMEKSGGKRTRRRRKMTIGAQQPEPSVVEVVPPATMSIPPPASTCPHERAWQTIVAGAVSPIAKKAYATYQRVVCSYFNVTKHPGVWVFLLEIAHLDDIVTWTSTQSSRVRGFVSAFRSRAKEDTPSIFLDRFLDGTYSRNMLHTFGLPLASPDTDK